MVSVSSVTDTEKMRCKVEITKRGSGASTSEEQTERAGKMRENEIGGGRGRCLIRKLGMMGEMLVHC